ncbi:MAG: hypothetical protein FWB91_14020 [Defluviitaleaceae bacterium]|nr:hypothetical protein [Defluviitaleaceae bacterium]
MRSKDQQPQNVAEKNRTEARSADCGFLEPSRRKAAYSYRMLSDVKSTIYDKAIYKLS